MPSSSPMAAARPVAVVGVLGLVLNLVAVGLLGDIASPYRVEHLADWARTSAEHPVAASQSAWAFAFGLTFLAVWGSEWGRLPGLARPEWARLGGRLMAAGAMLDAVGCLGTDVGSRLVDGPTSVALFGLSVLLDAAFNGLLGLGLLCAAVAGGPIPMRVLGAVAGVVSVAVTAQAWTDDGARLLGVAGPLWLTWCAWACVRMWRGR